MTSTWDYYTGQPYKIELIQELAAGKVDENWLPISEPKSYRDLPYRLADFGTVYRYEQGGGIGRLDPCPWFHN